MIMNASGNALTFSGSSVLSAAAGNDLIFLSPGAGISVSAPIAAAGGGAETITKASANTLTLSGSNDIANVFATGGTVAFVGSASAASDGSVTSRTFDIQNGAISFTADNYSDLSNVNLVVGQNNTGNSAISVDASHTATIGSASTTVQLNAPLVYGTANTLANLTLAGQIQGTGEIQDGPGTQATNGRTILALANGGLSTVANWSGGVLLRAGAELQVMAPGALGTGPISNSVAGTNANKPGTVQIDVTNSAANSTGPVTIANAMYLNGLAAIVNWKTDSPLTLSGNLEGDGGLLLQGFASGSSISQTVLSGTVAVSGVPNVYSYGGGVSVQNFVNGAGGISEGATGFQAAAVFSTDPDAIDQPGTTDTTGALGYVRFDGPQSYIPGQVGPGYLAALQTSGTGNAERIRLSRHRHRRRHDLHASPGKELRDRFPWRCAGQVRSAASSAKPATAPPPTPPRSSATARSPASRAATSTSKRAASPTPSRSACSL